jgi:hypothetical protein
MVCSYRDPDRRVRSDRKRSPGADNHCDQRRRRVVRTKEDFDAALAMADQIIMEGNDALLSYAINKAAADPENRVTSTGSVADVSA